MPKSRQKKRNSIEDKFKVLKETENGQPKSLVAEKYGVPRNTVSTWLLPAHREKIMAGFSFGTINLKRKNVKAGKYEKLNKAVFKWFMSASSSNIPVSGLVLKEKANDLAKKLDIANFKASNELVDRWKARNNIITINIIIVIITKSLFNVGHIHLQNFRYIDQANKNQPWNIIDMIITMVFVHNT